MMSLSAMLHALVLAAASAPPPQELVALEGIRSSWIDAWEENLRWDLDLSSRTTVDSSGDLTHLGAVGLDLHKVFSDSSSIDRATLTLQPFLLRIDGPAARPPIFDSDHDFELQWRIANLNVAIAEQGKLNLRVGHFELPFGLEQNLDTNGTLRRTTHVQNFGFVADWGATVNGELPGFDYEFGWSRGSGNEYVDAGGRGVFSGRVGTPREDLTNFGLSIAHGDFLQAGTTSRRTRVGVDAQTGWRAFEFRTEVSTGQVDSQWSTRALFGMDWRNPYESRLAWAQLIGAHNEQPGQDQRTLEARLGYQLQASRDWTLSAQFIQPLVDSLDTSSDATLMLQLRVRL